MCVNIVESCKNTISSINNTFVKVTDDLFGKNVGSAIRKITYGLPATLAGLYLPWTILVPVIVAVAIAHIVLDKNPVSNFSYQILFRAIGNIGITKAVIHTVNFAKTGSNAYLMAIGGQLLWAKTWYLAERLLSHAEQAEQVAL